MRFTATRVAPFLLPFLAWGCTCPTCPPQGTLPGKDFATPENAFEYLREAVIRGEKDDAYAHEEFRCLSEKLVEEKKITREDYFFVRSDVKRFLRERIGDLESVSIERVSYNGPNEATLDLKSGAQKAKVNLVRETVYNVYFRYRTIPEVYGSMKVPADGVRIADSKLMMSLAIEEALAAQPKLRVDDIYRVEFESSWKFFGIENTDFKREVERLVDEKKATRQKDAGKPKAVPPKS